MTTANDPAPLASTLPGTEEALCLGPERADHRLVLLHGWGADADDLLELGVELLGSPEHSGGDRGPVSLVALRAPLPHPGGGGRQWYDLLPTPAWGQLPQARAALRRRLLALAASVPLERTAVLGFSQGAAMALDVVTGSGAGSGDGRRADGAEDAGEGPVPVAALIACSGYPHPDWQPGRTSTRILLTHGDQDPMVTPAASQELERALQSAEGAVQRLTFPGGHGIDPALLPTLRAFLEESWAG